MSYSDPLNCYVFAGSGNVTKLLKNVAIYIFVSYNDDQM